MAWQAEQIQFVAFDPSMSQQAALDVWQALFDQPPDEFQKRKIGPFDGSVAAGTVDGYAVVVTCQPGRSEFVIRASDPNPQAASVPPNIPDVDNVLSFARELGRKLVGARKPSRLGAVVNLVEVFPSMEEASDFFASRSGVNVFPKGSTDVLIQHNLPIKSECDTGVIINQLQRSGVTAQQSVLITFDQSGRQIADPTQSAKRFVCFLHLDVNTSPESKLVEARSTEAVLNELWDRANALRKS